MFSHLNFVLRYVETSRGDFFSKIQLSESLYDQLISNSHTYEASRLTKALFGLYLYGSSIFDSHIGNSFQMHV